MKLFLSHFAKSMDFVDKNWRENTAFLFDGEYFLDLLLMILYSFDFRSKISPQPTHVEKDGTFVDESDILWTSEL